MVQSREKVPSGSRLAECGKFGHNYSRTIVNSSRVGCQIKKNKKNGNVYGRTYLWLGRLAPTSLEPFYITDILHNLKSLPH